MRITATQIRQWADKPEATDDTIRVDAVGDGLTFGKE